MAINRFQAALGAITNEASLIAGAQINLDFTLIKHEAPKEFQKLGTYLSQNRKEEAEGGQLHITARRLGALFEGVCPPTPNLIKAYGERASEISGQLSTVPDNALRTSLFAKYSGIDGTAIWAAATSSTEAIQVQLLACMLARMFDAPESISVWVELVEARKHEIGMIFQNAEILSISHLNATVAARGEISRAHLAQWDASARAWLRAADSLKTRQQKQLMLILDNVGLPVNEDVNVYTSVIDAWKASMTVMENLIRGIPQAAEIGAAILGLSAWHLFPDLAIVGSKNPLLAMHDSAFAPGGVLTIGMQRPKHHHKGEARLGVYWNLSLAHLRYYGRPVLKYGKLNVNTSRIQFKEFMKIVFGCLMDSWGLDVGDVEVTTKFFVLVASAIRSDLPSYDEVDVKVEMMKILEEPHWFALVTEVCADYQKSNDEEKEFILRYIKLGLRRSIFLDTKFRGSGPDKLEEERLRQESEVASKFFGLVEAETLLAYMTDKEQQIAYLRQIAIEKSTSSTDRYLVRFRWKGRHAYATAIPAAKYSAIPEAATGHKRWYITDYEYPMKPSQSRARGKYKVNYDTPEEENIKDVPDIPGELCVKACSNKFESFTHSPASFTYRDRRYDYYFGDENGSALFVHSEYASGRHRPLRPVSDVIPQQIVYCLEHKMMLTGDKNISLATAINLATTSGLAAVTAAFSVYQHLPEATVDLGVLHRSASLTRWAVKTDNNRGIITHCSALSCIAYFSSGNSDIDPAVFDDAFAISVEDSIYISSRLLCDPWDEPNPYVFKRILGNVGRSGLTILVPPPSPMIRSVESGAWRVANYAAFDGAQEDHFTNTTLHLAFTEYCRPVHQTIRGEQDIRVAVLESIISVYDKSEWVADIDFMKVMEILAQCRLASSSTCKTSINDHRLENVAKLGTMVSLDTWDEILDPPKSMAVARAFNNPFARLAVAAVLAQMQMGEKETRQILLCPPHDDVCLTCSQRGDLKDAVLVY